MSLVAVATLAALPELTHALAVGTKAADAAALPVSAAVAATVGELRCGWFVNPTPANAWLIDRDGEWLIGVQGGPQAEGDWPDFSPARWVRSNGAYGHGCACLRVTVNRSERRILILHGARSRPLAACRQDRRLPPP